VKPLATHYFVVNRLEPTIIRLKTVKGHPIDDIAGEHRSAIVNRAEPVTT
jgi:hypothetical protein